MGHRYIVLAASRWRVLIWHRTTSQIPIRDPFIEPWGSVVSGTWGAGTSLQPSPTTPHSLPLCSYPHPDPRHPPSSPFVGLFHFDFMFAHLMALRWGKQRHSTKDPMRRPHHHLHRHTLALSTFKITHTHILSMNTKKIKQVYTSILLHIYVSP